MAVQKADYIHRDYEVDGVSASGFHKVIPREQRVWGTNVENMLAAGLSNGGLIYDTKANMNADLAHPANASAWVIGDATAANNGIYRKSGESGSGAWTRIADLPYSVVYAQNDGSGTANVIVATSSVPVSATAYSQLISVPFTAVNTGAMTISINSETARPLVTNTGAALEAGYITAGMSALVQIDSDGNYRLFSYGDASAIQAAVEEILVETKAARDAALGAVPNAFSATRTAMKALSTATITAAYLKEADREGQFIWDGSDLSAKVTADTAEGVFVAPTSDTTGASGAWVRQIDNHLSPKWFGASPSLANADNKTALQAAIVMADFLGGGVIVVPPDINYGYELTDNTTHPDFTGCTSPLLVLDYGPGDSYTAPASDGSQTRKFYYTPQTTPRGQHDGNSEWWFADWSFHDVMIHTMEFAAPGDPSRDASDNLRVRRWTGHAGAAIWSLGQCNVSGADKTVDEMLSYNLVIDTVPGLSITGLTTCWNIARTDLSYTLDLGTFDYRFRPTAVPTATWEATADNPMKVIWKNPTNTVQWNVPQSSSANALELAVNTGLKLGVTDGGVLFTTGGLRAGSASAITGDAAVHTFDRASSSEADAIVLFCSGATTRAQINAVTGTAAASGATGFKIAANSSTSRSINAGGTINASGADYAEYRKVKDALHGGVAKGALLGMAADGLLTDKWSEVVGRVFVKSTAPNLVGNDGWGREDNICAIYGVEPVGNSPEPTLPKYVPPGEPHPEEDDIAQPSPTKTAEQLASEQAERDAALAKWRTALAAYDVDYSARYMAADANDKAAMADYEARKAAFETALEAERVKWDRMAMCGVVPANVATTLADIGKYLVAVEGPDDTIAAIAVGEDDLTLKQYIRSFGVIEGIRADGRPDVLVKIT